MVGFKGESAWEGAFTFVHIVAHKWDIHAGAVDRLNSLPQPGKVHLTRLIVGTKSVSAVSDGLAGGNMKKERTGSLSSSQITAGGLAVSIIK